MRQAEASDLEDFSATLIWIPVDTDVARLGASLARRYRASYGGLEDVDYRIAATALLLDAELLTTNVRHFPMFEACVPRTDPAGGLVELPDRDDLAPDPA